MSAGKPLILYVEGEENEDRYLIDAMAREGIQLDSRKPDGLPGSLQELAGYDAVILSDVPAHQIGEVRMLALRDYVEKLGGGFVMIGGMRSFGVGGYYRTPIEEILPVKLKAPDQEEFMSSALALVIDRSGSMAGQEIEVCKSAAIATTELLSPKDYIGVYAFDSQAHVIVPMTKVTSTSTIANQIAVVGSGGGTNIYPAMVTAREELGRVKAKIKHMIVLTDGQTSGQGYQALASQCQAEGITISTVAVGAGAQIGLLQTIAAAGGGTELRHDGPGRYYPDFYPGHHGSHRANDPGGSLRTAIGGKTPHDQGLGSGGSASFARIRKNQPEKRPRRFRSSPTSATPCWRTGVLVSER